MNHPSELLTDEENAKILEIVQQSNRKNQALAVGVVKLYLSDPSENHMAWIERVAGVACFTKDYGRKSYYIQIFDIQYQQQVWEQEAYLEMVYRAPETWFQTFEAEHSMVGLSFADEREAGNFLDIVKGKLDQRHAKSGANLSSPVTKQISTSPRLQKKSPPVVEVQASPKLSKKKKKQGSKKGINKLDISGPDLSTFVHVTGVKSDGTGGMKMVDNSHLIDPVLKKYLTIAGIDSSALGAQEIEQVKQFAEKENLYEQVERRKTVKREQKRQNKTSGRPPPPTGQKQKQQKGNLQPIEEQRTGPPPIPGRPPTRPDKPPPSIPPARNPSTNKQGRRKPANVPPPPPSGGSGPPPPPPPGPSIASTVPKLPSSSKPNRGDLNSQISKFSGSLKKVDPNASSTKDAAPARGDLLSQIRAGASLRKVDENEIERRSTSVEEEGLMGVLIGALANIHEANFSSSEEDSDDDDSDWGDE